jgi:hypothetical protein
VKNNQENKELDEVSTLEKEMSLYYELKANDFQIQILHQSLPLPCGWTTFLETNP